MLCCFIVFSDFSIARVKFALPTYINAVTGRDMLLWDGACHVHERFSVEKLVELKRRYPGAKVLVHPECKGPVVKLADVVGSTRPYTTTSIHHIIHT